MLTNEREYDVYSRWARVARGWTAASFAIFVAAFSHTLAGGNAPTLFGIAVSLVISGALCTMLTGRQPSIWRLIVSVGISQVLFHWLFSGLGTPIALKHGMTSMGVDAAAAPHHDAGMLLAHVIAGVITIVALRYSGSAFWGVADTARLLFARLVGLLIPVVQSRPPHPAIAIHRELVRDLSLFLSSMRHRGPPLELA